MSLLITFIIDKYTQSWVIAAITKILARCEYPHELFRSVNLAYLNADAKQRYFELKAIIDVCVDAHEVLPFDASCEELEVDENLGFLDCFVEQSKRNGARSYCEDNKDKRNQYVENLSEGESIEIFFFVFFVIFFS